MTFSDIIGHKDVIRSLTAALRDGKAGHAYLFAGPAGVGKRTLARAWAGGLLCGGSGADDCDCDSCRRFRIGAHPDFLTITPTGNSIKIEQLRELQHIAYLRPIQGERKVIFFPEAELLTEAAANSFLKLLEEPPPGVVFLFTAVRLDYILPTIRSRCQVFQLFPVAAPVIEEWLIQRGMAPAAAKEKALRCHGSPGKAIETEATRNGLVGSGIMELLNEGLLDLLKTANELEKKERRDVILLLREWEAQLRDELLLAGQNWATRRSTAELIFALQKLGAVVQMIESNVNTRLAMDAFFAAVKGYRTGN